MASHIATEKSLLIASEENLKKNPTYGTYEDYKSPCYKKKQLQDVKKISISKLFSFASKTDKLILIIGTIFAIIHGAGMPVLSVVFGNMTNIFIKQTIFGFANFSRTTTVSDLVNPLYPAVTSVTPSLNNRIMIDSRNITARIFDDGELLTREEFFNYMSGLSMQYAFIGLGIFVAAVIQTMCWEISCERQTYRLRQEFFYQVLRQEVSWFDEHQTGDLAMKLSDDLERVREGIGHKFSLIVQYVATFITGFGVGFATNWELTVVILAITPLLAGASAFVGKMIATQSTREQQKYGKAGAVAEEVLSSIKTVASFGKEAKEIQRYEYELIEGLRFAIKKYHVLAIGIGLVFFIMYGSYSLGFWYGCLLLANNIVTPGDIFTVFFSVLVGAFSLGNAIPFVSTVGIAQGSGAVVFEVIDSRPKIDPYSKTGLMPDSVIGRIQFRNVYFNYPTREEVRILRKFDMEIEPGKTVAIVGASGAGKSTIISLILRFYDPESGAILLDGFDVKGLNLAWLRHHIGVVSQEPVLFGTTIYENISYGRDYVTPDEIVTAARMANAHDFISSLPQGYETLVGERGAQLSGGQKQRIAIARALVRDPRILLLDEATSALDSRSEAIVQAALDKARQGRTTIIVAHRLSTIKDADFIYAIKDGTVAESGTHPQLMAKEGLYFDFVTAQISRDSIDDMNGAEASLDSSEESIHEYNVEVEKRRRRRTRGERLKYSRGQVLVDPDTDKARLLMESKDLHVKYPGLIKILKVNSGEWHLLAGGFIGCLVTGTVMPIFALFYAEMFASFLLTGQELTDASIFWSLMFLALAVASGIGFWFRTIFVATAGEYLTMKLRTQSYIGVVRQSIGWFDNESNSPGRLSTRLARDAPLVKAAAGHRLAVVITSFITIIIALGVSFVLQWRLALVLTAGFPLLVFAGYFQVQVQKVGQKKDAVLMEDAGRIAIEAIQSIRTVQSISQEKLFFQKYLEFLVPAFKEAQCQGLIYGFAVGLSEAAIFLLYAVSFYYGGYLIGIEIMAPIDVFRIFFVMAFCAISVGQATSFIPDYMKANLAAALIFNLIETKSTIDPFSPEGLKPKFEGRITFSEVDFKYPNRDEFSVLQRLSFDLQPGQTLALVGPSGCGKSTVVSLLERFYDVNGGQIMIDGYDVRTLNISHLRANLGLVTQEPLLFDCSIRENIAYGYAATDEVPEELIYEAARSANIHNFILGLPQGYETFVGERGTQLSGGQKQRIAIARALIRDPKILLLDEATSALDTESEKIVQEALDRARAGRTCIIIAHRLSTVQNADCIAVVSRGKIVEIGTHEQLKAKRGIYFKLTKTQQITH